jgi:hypothetical protein
MNKLLFFFLLTFVFSSGVSAQGTIVIKSDPVLDSIIEANKEWNKSNGGMQGFRVQIYFGSERKVAMETRNRFLQQHPETDAYLIYQQPYFKVRIGDYRTKFEAYPMYKKLLQTFEKVFIVPDKINLPKI